MWKGADGKAGEPSQLRSPASFVHRFELSVVLVFVTVPRKTHHKLWRPVPSASGRQTPRKSAAGSGPRRSAPPRQAVRGQAAPPGRNRPSRSESAQRARRKRSPSPPRPCKIHVGRLTRNVTRDHLLEIFGCYGTVKGVELPPDRTHGHLSRGFAYVEFENPADAERAMRHMDGGQIDGQEVTAASVLLPRPMPPRRPSPPAPPRRPPAPPPHWRRSPPPRPRPPRR
ncbi:RNA binding protein, putative [Ixodes scapularis]|uniref:RNA binding protein, putative n=1 Tax=Ixodes scapularis TaxID=6945 RepID=B7Q031_IXOSC|nr:RNA binding protein, putative [Ixodes scapularis]|eukprot:XP_002406762.1 RNA binding protein, putative [Ixodes scapularis]